MMDRPAFQSFKVSLRVKLIVRLLILIAAITLIWAAISISAIKDSSVNSQEMSRQTVLAQAENFLLQLTEKNARENDLILSGVIEAAQQLSGFVASVYNRQGELLPKQGWNFENQMLAGEQGQFSNDETDITSVFVPNFKEVDGAVLLDVELGGYLDLILPSVFDHTQNAVAVYFSTPNEVTRYYPNVNLGAVLPPDFKATQRVWYTGSVTPENENGSPYWSEPYLDATGLGVVTTAALAVYDVQNELVGVIGIDFTLTDMKVAIEGMRLLESGYTFLVDSQGRAIALPEQAYRDFLDRDPEANEYGTDLTVGFRSFQPILSNMMAGKSGFESLKIKDRDFFIAYAPLPSTGWSLGSVVEGQEVLGVVADLQDDLEQSTRTLVLGRILPVSVLILVIAIILGLLFTNQIVGPLRQLAEAVQRVGRGEWEVPIPVAGNDEIGVLAQAFSEMKGRLYQAQTNLEATVKERTRVLLRRSEQLETASQIARDAASIRQVDVLLQRAVDLIRQRFGFYHAGIFLVDERRTYVVLRSATGDAGEKMLAAGHRLRVGPSSQVGFTASSGLPRIALDTGVDAIHFKNPMLPLTRSEMALPMKVREEVIGVLDVQSTDPEAFDQEDIAVLQIMADQLAVALDNAILLEQYQESVRNLEQVGERYTQDIMKRLDSSQRISGYEYGTAGVTPVSTEGDDGLAPIHFPLKVRGETVASLEVWPTQAGINPAEYDFLNDLGGRLGQAIESARLFEEAQTRAAREQVLNEFVSHLSKTLDLDALMQLAVKELAKMPNVNEVSIHLIMPEDSVSDDG